MKLSSLHLHESENRVPKEFKSTISDNVYYVLDSKQVDDDHMLTLTKCRYYDKYDRYKYFFSLVAFPMEEGIGQRSVPNWDNALFMRIYESDDLQEAAVKEKFQGYHNIDMADVYMQVPVIPKW